MLEITSLQVCFKGYFYIILYKSVYFYIKMRYDLTIRVIFRCVL